MISSSFTAMCSASGDHGQRGSKGRGLDCGHHMAEEAPEELAKELHRFLTGSGD